MRPRARALNESFSRAVPLMKQDRKNRGPGRGDTMVNSLVEGSLAMSSLLTVFLLSYWTMKAFMPKVVVIPATVGDPRRKKA